MDTLIHPVEIDSLILAIRKVYGYNFADYSRTSFTRRLTRIIHKYKFKHLGDCQHRIIHDPEFFQCFLTEITVTTSEFFRDPLVFKKIQEEVFPYLANFASFKVWHVGCGMGEEVYSLAILLQEAKLYSNSIIYATDINRKALEFAKHGLFSNAVIGQADKNYARVNSKKSFTRYVTQNDKDSILDPLLKSNIVFSTHNLVSDQSFGEMQLILCRNVMIYFNRTLQDRVLSLLTESLSVGGYLCIGSKENLKYSIVAPYYEVVDRESKLYRKIKNRN